MTPRVSTRVLGTALLAVLPVSALAAFSPAPPPTRVEVVRDTLHGIPFEDPYRWLEEKDAPETRTWVKAQMDYTQGLLGKVPGRDEVLGVLARHLKVDSRALPLVRGKRLFFLSRKVEQQQSVLTLRERHDGPDVTLVDPNPLSPDHTTSVSLVTVSRDGKFLVYGFRKGGEDELELRVFDVDQRKDVPGGLPKGRYFGVQFDKANKGFWYSRYLPEGTRVRYHKLGDDPALDAVVFGEQLQANEWPWAQVSDNGRWLMLGVTRGSSGDDVDLYLKNVEKNGPVVTVVDTLKCSLSFTMVDDRLVLTTDWKAPNQRILWVDAKKPQLAYWKEIVPESKDAVIEDTQPAGDRLYVTVLQNVTSKLRVYGLDGVGGSEVPLPGTGTTEGMSGEWAGGEGYFRFSSFHQPHTIYRYEFATGNAAPWWKSSDPFDPEPFDVRQFSIRSTKGVRIPFYVVSRKGLEFNGRNKVLLYGYGGFNVGIRPEFKAFVASWLELGGVFVSANLRGGNEFGEAWHRDGMLENKQHVFDDFVNVSGWLLQRGYCLRQNLGIIGDSNGGLLVAAAMTQRPDFYGAVVCQVPLLDMIRYHRFLVARFWVPEYGSSEDPKQLDFLRGYSPYHRIQKGTKYPSILFTTGDSDTRVDPLHARKMTALMQAQGGDNPALLLYDLSSGHAGGQSVDKTMQDYADQLQFLRWRLGMVDVPQ
jgi:prolyl oligopeptidase